LPQTFFTSILPGVEDIGELKLTLYLFQLLYRKRGAPRCVSDRELLADRALRQALRRKGDPRAPEERLRAALELAVARATLLRVRVRVDGEVISWYFFNRRSRLAVARLPGGGGAGDIARPEDDDGGDARSRGERADADRGRAPHDLPFYSRTSAADAAGTEELREADERYPAED
jgi:hypothetical protein